MAQALLGSQKALDSSDPGATLRLSQQTPTFLRSQTIPSPRFPSSMFCVSETSQKWTTYEQLLLACLRTGDDKSAHLCLDQLTKRFGPSNERVMGLRGLYQEAVAEDTTALEKVLREYEEILSDNPVNVPILKRRVAILRSMSRPSDAISALVEFVNAFPTDAEAWCELADLYQAQGMSSQAIFSLEEALLIAPNSWNLHARLGELQYISAVSLHSEPQQNSQRLLTNSVRQFCRSIELCDDYLRGFYGLKMASSLLLENLPYRRSPTNTGKGDDSLPTKEAIERLNNLATRKLANIIRDRCCDIGEWGSSQGELIAAQELLDRQWKGGQRKD